jgi:hypothetical protein
LVHNEAQCSGSQPCYTTPIRIDETPQTSDADALLFVLRGRSARGLYLFNNLVGHLGGSLVAIPGERFAARDEDSCLRVEDGKSVEEAYGRSAVELNLEVGEFLVVNYSQPQRLE